MTDDSKSPWWHDGRVVVSVFLGFCFLIALGSVLLTVFGQQSAPDVPEPPAEIGHPIVP